MRASNEGMHSHDLDLIAALAEGTLDDETQARAFVQTCDECRAEFEAQTAVLAAIADVPAVTMTENEKAILHRDLWTELRLGEGTEKPTRAQWWYRFSYAAAGVLIVVGIGAGVLQLTGGEQAVQSFSEVGSSLGGGAGPAFDQPDAAGEEAAEAPEAVTADDGAMSGSGEGESMDFAAMASEVRARPDTLTAQDRSETDLRACLETAGLVDQEPIALIGEYILAVPADQEVGPETQITFVETGICQVAHVDG